VHHPLENGYGTVVVADELQLHYQGLGTYYLNQSCVVI